MPCYDGHNGHDGSSNPEVYRLQNEVSKLNSELTQLRTEYSQLKKHSEFLKASLCAVIRSLQKFYDIEETPQILMKMFGNKNANFLAHLDYVEAGISKEQLSKWWKEHDAEDIKRREQERQQKLLKDIRSKLNAEELEFLNKKLR